MEQTHHMPTAKVELSAYRKTIHQFLPFVLIKCSKFTNSKRLADVIAIYTFISVYRIAEILDGYNMPVLIESMIGIVGDDLNKGTNKSVNGQLLFKWEDDLHFAQRLSVMDMKECLGKISRNPELTARNFDLEQFERITEATMAFLKNNHQHLPFGKRL
jgi:hypothetical protein